MKNELIRGYIARVRYFAAECGLKLTLQHLGMEGNRLPWAYPSQLNKISQLFHPAVPSANELIERHTLFPLLRPFLPDESIAVLRQHHHESGVPGVVTIAGSPHSGKSGRWNLAICMACVKEDKDFHSFTYWRTAHLLPGLALCSYDFEPLYKYCESCQYGFRHSKSVWLPTSRCVCNAELQAVRTIRHPAEWNAERAISAAVQQILSGGIPNWLGHDRILQMIAEKAHRVGYNGSQSGLRRIRTLLEDVHSPETLDAYKFSTGLNTVFQKTLAGTALSKNPVHNIILINALFGSLSDFVAAASQEPVPPEQVSLISVVERTPKRRSRRADRYARWTRLDDDEIGLLRQDYRAIILTSKANRSALKRSDLRGHREREAYAFLLRFDGRWLDDALPRQELKAKYEERGRLKRECNDKSLSEHIYERRNELLESNFPSRITRRRLLLGHTMESSGRSVFANYPATEKALAECVETFHEWHRRQVGILLSRVHEVSIDAPFSPSMCLTEMGETEIKKLTGRLQTWLKKNVSV